MWWSKPLLLPPSWDPRAPSAPTLLSLPEQEFMSALPQVSVSVAADSLPKVC